MLEVCNTAMFREAAEAPDRVEAMLQISDGRLNEVVERIRAFRPRAVLTCGRGSSDNAATHARYLIETELGLFTASSPPSVASVYGAVRDLSQCLFIAISQSGRSPDLRLAAEAARAQGALVLALVNTADSPLAAAADMVLPIGAGVERSVAATKSFLCTLAVMINLVGHWSDNRALLTALAKAPGHMSTAWQLDWSALVTSLAAANHLYVVARGFGLGVAQEMALKLKETSALHAEAYSSAELHHGPIELAAASMPVLLLAQNDATRAGIEALAELVAKEGVPTLIAGAGAPGAVELASLDAHPVVQPLLLAQSFYRAANELAVLRGLDPDRPRRLSKATLTV